MSSLFDLDSVKKRYKEKVTGELSANDYYPSLDLNTLASVRHIKIMNLL